MGTIPTARHLTITVDNVRWTNHEDFSIVLGHEETALFAPIVVKLPACVQVGERWVVAGHFSVHGTYGLQFVASFAALDRPRTIHETRAFLRALGWSVQDVTATCASLADEDQAVAS